jgi:hypothetical protein
MYRQQTIEKYDAKLVTLERGLCGCYGECLPETWGDGNVSKVSRSGMGRTISAYFGDLIEGGHVIDKREVLEKHPGLAIRSPVCDASLPLGRTSRFVDVVPNVEESLCARAIASCEDHPMSAVARMMIAAPDCGSYDMVAPDVLAQWWGAHGAKVGRRFGNRIVWANGDESEIRPAENRYMLATGEFVED